MITLTKEQHAKKILNDFGLTGISEKNIEKEMATAEQVITLAMVLSDLFKVDNHAECERINEKFMFYTDATVTGENIDGGLAIFNGELSLINAIFYHIKSICDVMQNKQTKNDEDRKIQFYIDDIAANFDYYKAKMLLICLHQYVVEYNELNPEDTPRQELLKAFEHNIHDSLIENYGIKM